MQDNKTDLQVRAAKVAKRLYKQAEETGQLDIPNLTTAQEVTAKLFGYPNWHAMSQAGSDKTKNRNGHSQPLSSVH